MSIGSDTQNYDEVICPNCVHQFRAIPLNVQSDLARLTEENETLRKVIADVEDHTLTMANGYKSVEVKFVLNEIAGMLRAAIKEGS